MWPMRPRFDCLSAVPLVVSERVVAEIKLDMDEGYRT
jgi:hypothetical protein